MARFFYTLLYYLLLPFIALRLFWRGFRAPAYRERVAERFGCFPAQTLRAPIWVHAVSVGETIAAAPLIKALRKRYPQRDIVVTTMTPTGSERVQALFAHEVFHVYAPYDFPGAVQRFLAHIKPSLLIIMETELWPNMIHYCHQQNVPVILANARLSEKSARGYQRFAALTKPMLMQLSKVVAQSEADADRFYQLGLSTSQAIVAGSIKFDISLDDSLRMRAAELRGRLAEGRLVWLAASTHRGEEAIILQAYQQLLHSIPDLLLIIVPRHPERFNEVAEQIAALKLTYQRRSRLLESSAVVSQDTQVLLGDSMGELLLLLGTADLAFVGGSLIERGGHNMLEPAAWGLPIVTGYSDYNFSEISLKLQSAGALVKVSDAGELRLQCEQWLGEEASRNLAGRAALDVIAANRGALRRLLATIEPFID